MSSEEPTLPPEGMLLAGVDLGGDYERGTSTVHGVNLLFTADGITVQGPEPGAERLVTWTGLDSASCRAKARQGDGTTAVVLILQSGSQTVRCFLPADQVTAGQAAYLDQALPLWLARYSATAGSDSGSDPGSGAPPHGDTPPQGDALPHGDAPLSTPPVRPPPPRAPVPPASPAPLTTPVPLTASAPPGMPMRPVEASPAPSNPPRFFRLRNLFIVIVIGIVVALVVTGSVYLATNNPGPAAVSTTTPSTAAPPSADQQLASSVNLRLTDLPTGWARVPPIGSSLTPAEKRAQAKVVDQFATCLGMPQVFIGGLFGGLPQKDQMAAGDSPTFATAATPTTIAGSHTTVVKTEAAATADAVPFTKHNFTSCFSKFQSASVAVQVSGGSSQTTQMALFAPSGVSTYAYVTSATLPGKGTVLTDEVFMIGGRVEASLTLQTAGTPVSSDALDSAYTALVQRVASGGRT